MGIRWVVEEGDGEDDVHGVEGWDRVWVGAGCGWVDGWGKAGVFEVFGIVGSGDGDALNVRAWEMAVLGIEYLTQQRGRYY